MTREPENDYYGKYWDYRVFSAPWTCPDDWNVGHRHLTVHRVDYKGGLMGEMEGTLSHPLPNDLVYVDHEEAAPSGVGMEEYLLDLERIQQASDKPVLIKAEFQRYFDWSEKQERENAKRSLRYRKEERARERANRLRRQKLDQSTRELEAKWKAESEERIAEILKGVEP